jgi:dipeptidyl aminopeptidase/acylaminoacyl peptidase
MRPDGSEQQLILTGEMLDYGRQVWSPDGEWLAITLPDESAESFPYLLKSDGSERRLLSEYPITGTPAWSPDGQWIIFIRREDRNFNMYRIHPDGSNLQQIMSRPGPATLISWSPDSQWISFQTDQRFESNGLYRMRADGTDCQMLANVATGPVSWGPPLKDTYSPAIPLVIGGMMLIIGITPWKHLLRCLFRSTFKEIFSKPIGRCLHGQFKPE